MDDLNFLDLAILQRLGEGATIEKFGGTINTSFFEAANLLGTLKVKGLVNFTQSIGGESPIEVTDNGVEFLKEAEDKAKGKLTSLDTRILEEIGAGATKVEEVRKVVNVRPRDFALHLEKLFKRGYMDYTIRSAQISLSLTEKGFSETKGVKRKVITAKEESDESEDAKAIIEEAEEEKEMPIGMKRKMSKFSHYWEKYKLLIVILVIIIIALLGYLIYEAFINSGVV